MMDMGTHVERVDNMEIISMRLLSRYKSLQYYFEWNNEQIIVLWQI